MGSWLKSTGVSALAALALTACGPMTPQERARPDVLNGSRRLRIAKGSGRPVAEVNRLMEQFKQMQKMMKSLRGMGGMGRMMMPRFPGLR